MDLTIDISRAQPFFKPKGPPNPSLLSPQPLACINLNRKPTGQSAAYYKLMPASGLIFGCVVSFSNLMGALGWGIQKKILLF